MPVPQIVIDQAKAIIDTNLAVIKEVLKDKPNFYNEVVSHLAKEIAGQEPDGHYGQELNYRLDEFGDLYMSNDELSDAISELGYLLSSKVTSFRELYQMAKDNGYEYNGGQLKDDIKVCLCNYLLTQSELAESEVVEAQIAGLHIDSAE